MKKIPPGQRWAWTEAFERRLAELPNRLAPGSRLSDPGVLEALELSLTGAPMTDLFLPYIFTYDPDSRTFRCAGINRAGKPFGVGAGVTREIAMQQLREAILESLFADAADGNDHTVDLHQAPQGGASLVFTRMDLAPIRALALDHPPTT